jgi:hypothetical protein
VSIPVDKSTISPVRGIFYGSPASWLKHCLPYPSALTAENKDTLAQLVEPIAKYFSQIPSAKIDRDAKCVVPKLIELYDVMRWAHL